MANCAGFRAPAMPSRLAVIRHRPLNTGFSSGARLSPPSVSGEVSCVNSGREVKHAGCPLSFPQFLLDYATCSALFADFRDNYRRYESWHIRQRQHVLAARCKHVGDLLRMELRDAAPEQVDSILVHRQPEIVAVDVPSSQLCLAAPIDDRGHSEWRLDGFPVQLMLVDGCTYQLSGDSVASVDISLDSELEQTQLLTSVADLHQEFFDLWAPRWGKHAQCTEADWKRIVEFGQAFLPRGDLELAPIQLSQ